MAAAARGRSGWANNRCFTGASLAAPLAATDAVPAVTADTVPVVVAAGAALPLRRGVRTGRRLPDSRVSSSLRVVEDAACVGAGPLSGSASSRRTSACVVGPRFGTG